jgi:hypothetical protein
VLQQKSRQFAIQAGRKCIEERLWRNDCRHVWSGFYLMLNPDELALRKNAKSANRLTHGESSQFAWFGAKSLFLSAKVLAFRLIRNN